MSNEGKGHGRYKCPRCLYRFRYKSLLERHLRSKTPCLTLDEMPMGPTPDPVKCPDCGREYSVHASLVRHQKSGRCKEPTFVDRDLSCPFCGKVFTRTDNRKRHVESRCPVRKKQLADRAESKELALVVTDKKRLEDRIVELERKLESARFTGREAAAAGGAGCRAGPTTAVEAGDNSSVSVDSSVGKTVDNSVGKTVDNSVHIHIHGQEDIRIDSELIAALEHELRNTDLASTSYARQKLIERLIFRGLQSRPENRTIRGFDGARVGLHLGGDRWEQRSAREVAKTTATAIEAGAVRKLRAEGDVTPLVRRALEAPGIDPKERERWADFDGMMMIGSVGHNNARRAEGEDVEIVLA